MPIEARICLGVIVYTILISGFTSLWLGSVNFALNSNRSLRRSIILNQMIGWIIPKYGSSHDSHGKYPYKTYLYTVIMSLINIFLALLAIVLGISLSFTIGPNVLYICIIPTCWFVISVLSGIIIRIKCKPDPNPFH